MMSDKLVMPLGDEEHIRKGKMVGDGVTFSPVPCLDKFGMWSLLKHFLNMMVTTLWRGMTTNGSTSGNVSSTILFVIDVLWWLNKIT